MSRTKCTVKRVKASPFITTAGRPFTFLGAARIAIELARTYTDGKTEKALLTIKIRPGYKTDCESTFFPISLLVPQWVPGDDNYNAAPVAHDVLYMLGGIVDGVHEPVKLSREEVDDILRGVWRCWGMSRFVAGCADKGVEIFAGGKQHWKNDSYGVRQFVEAKWEAAACSR